MKRLTEDELAAAVAQLPAWTVHEGKLHRKYQFPDFAHAMGFMAIAAPMIERMNHHPEWSNVYNRVTVDLVTHDAGGITRKDAELATTLEKIALKLT
jgi:4a-hydroxytetrahydrobiopterin dehydratase